jgi:hypothetical protein
MDWLGYSKALLVTLTTRDASDIPSESLEESKWDRSQRWRELVERQSPQLREHAATIAERGVTSVWQRYGLTRDGETIQHGLWHKADVERLQRMAMWWCAPYRLCMYLEEAMKRADFGENRDAVLAQVANRIEREIEAIEQRLL